MPASASSVILLTWSSIAVDNLLPNDISSKFIFLYELANPCTNLFKLTPIFWSIRPYKELIFKLLNPNKVKAWVNPF